MKGCGRVPRDDPVDRHAKRVLSLPASNELVDCDEDSIVLFAY